MAFVDKLRDSFGTVRREDGLRPLLGHVDRIIEKFRKKHKGMQQNPLVDE